MKPILCNLSYTKRHLNEVQPGVATGAHEQHSHVGVGGLDAAVQHAQEDRRVVIELHHELLSLLHELRKDCRPDGVGVVEKQVALACQLYLRSSNTLLDRPNDNISISKHLL